MPNDKAISLDNLQTFKTNCDSTYATKTELTEGLAGKQPTGNYALQTGTYAGMTVGNATNAENAEHATSADSATNATNANHATSADSATDAQAAAQADKLAAARTMQVNLASSNAAEFDGTENVTPGVTGILPVANGGTGASSLANVTVGNATKAEQLPYYYAYGNFTSGFTSEGFIVFKRAGNVCVCMFQATPARDINAWTDYTIATLPSSPLFNNTTGQAIGVGGMDSNDVYMQPLKVICEDNVIKINGCSHKITTGRHLYGFVEFFM